jgi:hypothetical protein
MADEGRGEGHTAMAYVASFDFNCEELINSSKLGTI